MSYCLSLLKEGSYDRYISVLLAPEEKREPLSTLYAFDLEIAKIAHAVKEPSLGEIRLNWWRQLFLTGRQPSANPVADALMALVEKYDLPQNIFMRYFDAHIFDFYHDPMLKRDDLEVYCGETISTIMQLSFMIMDKPTAPACADSAGHGGVALFLCHMVQDMVKNHAKNRCYIPKDLLNLLDVDLDLLIKKPPITDDVAQGRQRLLAALMAWSAEHYQAFIKSLEHVDKCHYPALLPIALTPLYSKKIQAKPNKVFEGTLTVSPMSRYLKLTKSALTGRF